MKNVLVCTILFSIISGCLGQPASNNHASTSASLNYGVEFNIETNTNVVVRGSLLTVCCALKNNSTNLVWIVETDPKYDFQALISNRAGKSYRLSPSPETQAIYRRVRHLINPGETYSSTIKIYVEKSIPPSNYSLKCETFIYVNTAMHGSAERIQRHKHKLVSNLVSIDIE